MGKYQAYPEYKDSGVEWINEIPAQWSSMGFGKAVQFMSNGASTTQVEESKDTVRVTRIETISAGVINLEKVGHVRRSDILPRFRLQKGDIQFSNINSLSMVGNCAIFDADEELFAGMNLLQIRPDYNRIHPQYMFYQLRTKWFRNSVEANAKPAINQASIPTGTLKQFGFLCPSLDEQEQIATFLDQETAKIDTLIDKQQQLIQLLKEKRQAVISHAVTKGLNPNAPMRDSGVEWLGKVPEHWVLKSYRYAAKIYRGKFNHRPRNDPAFYDGKYPFIQTGDVAQADKKITEYKQTLNERGIGVSQKFPAGTLVMAIAANIGDTAILDFEAYAPDSVVGFKPYGGIDLEFLRYSLKAALPALEQTSTQSTQANLNIDRIGAVKASFPPVAEQKEIVRLLDALHERYAIIEIKAKEAIELMHERRTALISAAVTGKIDVRHHASHPTGNDTSEVSA